MSVCEGNETHFPLELWPVGPNQFGWPVLATCWIGVLGVFVGAGPRHPPKKKGQTYPNPYSTACNPGCNVWMLQLSQDFVLLFSALQDFFIFRFQTLQRHLVFHPGWECEGHTHCHCNRVVPWNWGKPLGVGNPTFREPVKLGINDQKKSMVSLAQLGSQESSLLISSLGKIPLHFRWQPHPTHQQLVKSKVDKTNQPLSNTNYLNENANNRHNKPNPPNHPHEFLSAASFWSDFLTPRCTRPAEPSPICSKSSYLVKGGGVITLQPKVSLCDQVPNGHGNLKLKCRFLELF